MHIFPQLRKLERKYASELVVVGVHSAKFPTEKETDSLTVRRAPVRAGTPGHKRRRVPGLAAVFLPRLAHTDVH